MAKNRGVQQAEEVDVSRIRRDSRPGYQKFVSWLQEPEHGLSILALIGMVVFVAPAMTVPLAAITLFFALLASGKKKELPIRIPKIANMDDPSEPIADSTKFNKGDGIMYLGHSRVSGGKREQVWISNSDARTHAFTLGTTGSGKTQALLSWAFNSLSWGSSFVYVDGKADVELIYKVYSMCRRLGREDDFFVVNFMTGDSDAFERSRSNARFSNTINPLSSGSSNALTQLVSSLMPESGGDNAMWQGLAIGMINAVIIGLCYKRFKDGFTIDAGVLRDHIELNELIRLTKEFEGRTDVPQDLVFKPLKTYLLNLPGFDWANNLKKGQPFSEDTKKQHDFRSMQFLRQLTMLSDTYGDVFRAQIPEVDMLDVVLKRRICVVAIPSLEKSEEESQGVGKLVISALKLMMSKTLGSSVEGSFDESVESRPTKSPSPFIAVLDELGYYFTKGLAVMAAQARSLGFSLWPAGQDLSAMMRGSNKEEAESVIANTKFKISLALEDPEKTADLLIKTAGKSVISEVAGYEGQIGAVASASYKDNLSATIQVRERVTLEELRDMESGQSILMWRDRIVRMQNFYIFSGKGAIKQSKYHQLNRLLTCFPPSKAELGALFQELEIDHADKPEDRVLDFLINTNLAVGYDQKIDIKISSLLNDIYQKIDFESAKSSAGFEYALYHQILEDYKGSSVDEGRMGAPVLKPGSIGDVEVSIDQKVDVDPSLAVHDQPRISSDSFEVSFEEIFSQEGIVKYPLVPKISSEDFKVDIKDEVDNTPTVSSSAFEVEISDEANQHIAYLDNLFTQADENSDRSLRKISTYSPRGGGKPIPVDRISQKLSESNT